MKIDIESWKSLQRMVYLQKFLFEFIVVNLFSFFTNKTLIFRKKTKQFRHLIKYFDITGNKKYQDLQQKYSLKGNQ